MTPSRDISRLLDIMAALRTPGSGCPWDLEQNFATIAPYTIEEAYEVVDAIARGDLDDLRDELGDLLLQVVFHARMAEEQNAFAFGDVVEAISRKMVRRHPHVFADKDGRLTPSDVKGAWERIKAEEKAERAARRPPEEASHQSLLSGVKAGQPALARAMELQRKASSVGFDWNDPRAVLRKIREEADEIEAALDHGDAGELADETGDLLFALVNLARHTGVDPEMALRGTNAKFERRFGYIERTLAAQGRSLEGASLEEMDGLWDEAKGGKRKREGNDGQLVIVDGASRWQIVVRLSRLVRNDLHRMRHGIEAVDHDVALGLIDAHGHIILAVVETLVENFRIAMQPTDAGAVGGVD